MHISKSISILVVVLVLFAFAAGYLFIRGNVAPGTVSITGAPATESEATFVTLASELDSIIFDTSILADPRLLWLVDIHTAIIPETIGRTDPFSSI